MDEKVEIKAQSKIGSTANIKHKPGGGEKKVIEYCSIQSNLVNSRRYVHQFLSLTCDFQHCGILTSVDSDKPVQPTLSLETTNKIQSVA